MTAEIGHNSAINGDAKAALKDFLKRIETVIDEELDPAKGAIKDIYAEVKASGFDASALRKIVVLRAKDRAKYLEQKETIELYAHALGVEDLV